MKPRSSSPPQAGDVLFANLPEEGFAKQGKLRPALVLDTITRNGIVYLLVAKGTSQHIDELYIGEFVVRNAEDLQALRLTKPTKFQLRQLREIPLTDAWVPCQQASPMPKHLLKSMMLACRECGLA